MIKSYVFERMFNLCLTPKTKRLEMKESIRKHDMRCRFKFYKLLALRKYDHTIMYNIHTT